MAILTREKLTDHTFLASLGFISLLFALFFARLWLMNAGFNPSSEADRLALGLIIGTVVVVYAGLFAGFSHGHRSSREHAKIIAKHQRQIRKHQAELRKAYAPGKRANKTRKRG